MEFSIWTEKYRPKNLDEVKGHREIVDRLKAMVKNKNLPNLLLAGPPGVGKTSIILAVAKELYGDNWRANLLETNASMDRGIQVVREEIKDFARTKPIGDIKFKICLLDEADALTREAQQALRRVMEQYVENTRFCLITNYSSKIIDPIQSRCTVFRFKPLDKKEIRQIVETISKKESLKIDDSVVQAIIDVSSGDLRRVENILQSSAAISNKITEESIYEIISAAKPKEIIQILTLAIKKDFIKARELLLETMLKHGLSGLDVIKQIQEQIWDLEIDDKKKVEMIEKCGEVEFRIVEGSDEYLQLESLLASFTK